MPISTGYNSHLKSSLNKHQYAFLIDDDKTNRSHHYYYYYYV